MNDYEIFIEKYKDHILNKKRNIRKLSRDFNVSSQIEVRKIAQKNLKQNTDLSDEECEILRYIYANYTYAPHHLHQLFRDKETYQWFNYYYHNHPFFTKERKNVVRDIFSYLKYSFSIIEIKKFKSLFNNEEHLNKIVKEVIIIAKDKIKKEEERIHKYQIEIPKAQANVEIIERSLNNTNYKSKLGKFYQKMNEGYIPFIFQKEFGVDGAIIQYLSKFATSIEPLNLNMDESFLDVENYIIYFSKEDKEIINYMYHDFFPEKAYLLGIPLDVIVQECKLNGIPLLGQWPLLTSDVYEDFRRITFKITTLNYGNNTALKQNKDYSEESVRIVIEDLKKNLDFNTDVELAIFLYYSYIVPLDRFYKERWEILEEYKILSPKSEFNNNKKIKKKFLQKAVDEGIYKSKWKSEMKLYQFVNEIYPLAIFQYRSDWLERQSIDIFIPEVNIGIEYQGIQHYQPVEFFNGEKGFEERKYLDQLKKEKCELNNVLLIEWKYDEVMTKKRVIEKIKNARR